MEACWSVLKRLEDILGSLARLGSILERRGGVLEASCNFLEAFRSLLKRFENILKTKGTETEHVEINSVAYMLKTWPLLGAGEGG